MDIENSIESTTQSKPHFKREITLKRILVLAIWLAFFTGVLFTRSFIVNIIANENNKYGALPSLQQLENPSTQYASELYSADGIILGKYYRSNRTPIDYRDISPNMLNALYSTEDVRFFEHSGIDLTGIISIPYYLLKGKKKGASTITQQLAKNLFSARGEKYQGTLSDHKLWIIVVKLKEWITAVQIEQRYTKQEIVSMYLNTVSFGGNAFGLKVAAKTFFNIDQDSLKVEQAALLTGLLKAPTYYSPISNPENALRRRNTVLYQMNKYKYLDKGTLDSLVKQPIKLDYEVTNHNDGLAPYFRKVASNHLRRWCKKNGYDLYADGIKVYTTLNSKMQQYAEQAVKEHMTYLQNLFFDHWKGRNPWSIKQGNRYVEMPGFLNREIKKTAVYKKLKKEYGTDTVRISEELNKPRNMKVFGWKGEIDTTFSFIDSLKYYKHFLHTGFVSMSPKTGEIKAWVGGINHKYFKYDHVQQGKRQPGSTFKPIVYATILGEAGSVYSPCYKVVDAPVTFSTGDPENPTWTPQNADGNYSRDTLTLRQAMARSMNSITAYMMKIMGPETPQMVYKYARNMGIESNLEAVPAMCLGTFDLSIYELVGAYSTFMNQGVYTKPYFIERIEDRYGNIIYSNAKVQKQAISKSTAYVMQYMLRGATQERGGTAQGLRGRYPDLFKNENEIGAKTGTTQNYSDGWFMGVVPDLVSGTWVGGDHRAIHFKTIEYGQGARMAMPIWASYMDKVYKDESLGIKRRPHDRAEFELPYDLSCDPSMMPKIEDSDSIMVIDSTSAPLKPTFEDDDEEEL